MKLYSIDMSRLQHPEFGQFIIRFMDDVSKLSIDINADDTVSNYWIQLEKQSANFKLAIQQITAQEETKEIVALDIRRDHSLIAVGRQVSVYEYFETSPEKEAYAAGSIIMNNWKGLIKSNYEAETMGIQQLLLSWGRPEMDAYIPALHLQQHLDNLKTAAEAFEAVFSKRSVATVVKEVFDAKALRKELETTYKNMAEFIGVMAKNNTWNTLYGPLLDALNSVRRYFADVIAKREGNNNNE